jgi:tetratricopeptide (TPR) repeat protein
VVVFADDAAYTPFKPLRAGRPDPLVAGYFKPGRDLNYITLAAARDSSETTSVLFHEYVHSLVRNAYGAAPLWLDEGLAEYYSAYAVRPGRRPQARTGPALARRVRTLRAHALIPLAELLAADRQSPLYNDHDRRGIFYAQSWALVHYLMSDPTGGRGRQLAEYVGLTRSGSTPDDAVRRAFRVEPATLARGLSSYVRAGRYAERVEPLARFPAPAATIEVRALGAAEVKARLGDLLLRTDRPEEAEAYLRDAVALDPSLPAARVSLGLLRAREGRLAEAREELRRAVELDPQSHLAHYYHAGLLRLDGADADSTVAGYAEHAPHPRRD